MMNIIDRFASDGSYKYARLHKNTELALSLARDGLMEMWAIRQRVVGNEKSTTLRVVPPMAGEGEE